MEEYIIPELLIGITPEDIKNLRDVTPKNTPEPAPVPEPVAAATSWLSRIVEKGRVLREALV